MIRRRMFPHGGESRRGNCYGEHQISERKQPHAAIGALAHWVPVPITQLLWIILASLHSMSVIEAKTPGWAFTIPFTTISIGTHTFPTRLLSTDAPWPKRTES